MKTLTLSLLALALCSAPLFAQKDADQRGLEKTTPVAAAQTPKVVCTAQSSDYDKMDAKMAEHINSKCNVAYAVTSAALAQYYVIICCVPK